MIALLACLGLVALMTVVVVASMAIENWPRLRTPAPVAPPGEDDPTDADPGDPTTSDLARTASSADPADHTVVIDGAAFAAGASDVEVADDATPSDRPRELATGGERQADGASPATPAAARSTEEQGAVAPPAGKPEGALAIDGRSVRIRDRETADVLAALLFGGLAATRRSGADRAAAWVTASATPPSADPARLPAGVRLRGRTAKVAQLLAHRDGGQVWITLQPDVDIARGLARTPVTQPTLAGLVAWWSATQALPAVVEPTDASAIAESVDAVRDVLDETPWSEPIGRLHDVLVDAAAAAEPVLVSLAPADPHGEPNEPVGPAVSGVPKRAAPTS